MKTFAVILLMLPTLAFASPVKKSKWVKLGGDGDSIMSYDVTSVNIKSSSSTEVTVRTVHADRSYDKDKYVVDCTMNKLRLLSHYSYTRVGMATAANVYPKPKEVEDDTQVLLKLRTSVCEAASEFMLSDLAR